MNDTQLICTTIILSSIHISNEIAMQSDGGRNVTQPSFAYITTVIGLVINIGFIFTS